MNPFSYSLDNKRYHTLNYYYKKKYGFKVFKISLDAGFSCPNIDKNGAGCIYCDSKGSAAFEEVNTKPLLEQFNYARKIMENKWHGKYIGYFQAHSNTYAPLQELKEKYELILKQKDVIGLTIATRPDAITEETLNYLSELNQRCDLTIELGLQSSNPKTNILIKRGHDLETYTEMVKKLKLLNIKVCSHIINGLPYENKKEMLETITYLNNLNIDGIKIHMLYLENETPITKLYQEKKLELLSKDEYVDIVINQLELLNPEIVIHRITSDPNENRLTSPVWLLNKGDVLNSIDKEMKKRNTFQGKNI